MEAVGPIVCLGFLAVFLSLTFGPWGDKEEWSDAMESIIKHKGRNAAVMVQAGWCAPNPDPDRMPQFWDTWKGYNHGSLYKVLAVNDERVCYLVMYQGNPYWRDEKPPGTVASMTLESWYHNLVYAPEWNERTIEK